MQWLTLKLNGLESLITLIIYSSWRCNSPLSLVNVGMYYASQNANLHSASFTGMHFAHRPNVLIAPNEFVKFPKLNPIALTFIPVFCLDFWVFSVCLWDREFVQLSFVSPFQAKGSWPETAAYDFLSSFFSRNYAILGNYVITCCYQCRCRFKCLSKNQIFQGRFVLFSGSKIVGTLLLDNYSNSIIH